ncbi:hypothetical protein [Streptomyces sp. NPDC001450]
MTVRTAEVRSRGRRRAPRSGRPKAPAGLLPTPPDERERYSYVKRYTWVLTSSSFLGFACVLYSQADTARHSGWIWVFAPTPLLAVIGFLISLRLEAFAPSFDLKAHRRLVRRWQPRHYPSVDVFLPVCGEPLEVLHKGRGPVVACPRSGRVTCRA